MSIYLKVSNAYTTRESIEFFERYCGSFGEVVSAEMKSNKEVEYQLILINNKKEELTFEDSCSAGYSGEGSRGTYKILKMAGFNIEENYVYENSKFKLKK